MKKEEKKKDENKDLNEKIEECLKEKEEYLNGWKRAKADLINYQNDEAERIKGLITYSEEKIINEFLDVLDDFMVAEKAVSKEEIENNQTVKGLFKIKDRMLSAMNQFKVTEIESINSQFDPNFHEAVEMVDGDKESGTIVEEVSKGYIRENKLLRPAKVKIIK